MKYQYENDVERRSIHYSRLIKEKFRVEICNQPRHIPAILVRNQNRSFELLVPLDREQRKLIERLLMATNERKLNQISAGIWML